MKAIVCRKYGATDVLHLEEVEMPSPRDNEVLVRVHAASMNDFDWGLVSGRPYIVRVFNGLLKPKIRIVGCDVAGHVARTGRYDLIIDARTFRSPSAYVRALERGGIYATVGGSMWRMTQILLSSAIIRRTRHKNLHIVTLQVNRHLEYARELFENGRLKPVIDRTYDLEQVPDAMQYYVGAQHKGKVMIRMASCSRSGSRS